ncbi:sucrase ferredoxin [Devosia sp.]|uniref:sucrase ferredoxin n=1 Tax=Devosia sp. TaxID=1871048 RepID=UPI00292F00AC|nr:sucrase ferredoxin [Devosia sp.]
MHRFCTDHAIGCGEPLPGTAALAERHLFMRWPKGNWRRPRFETVGLSDELRTQMRAATGDGRYVGLVDTGDGEALELLSFPDATSIVPRDQAHAAELIARWRDGHPLGGEPLPRRVILCCTDAKTDACCARYGFPVFKALVAAAPAFDLDVLQCTHIGGCHFAPSVIVMPDRQRYGRLTPAAVPEFLAMVARHDIYLPGYRGNPALTELEQSAEAAARRWADGRYPIERIEVAEVKMLDEDTATIEVRLNAEPITINAQRQIFPVYGNCRDMDGEAPDKARWVAWASP